MVGSGDCSCTHAPLAHQVRAWDHSQRAILVLETARVEEDPDEPAASTGNLSDASLKTKLGWGLLVELQSRVVI